MGLLSSSKSESKTSSTNIGISEIGGPLNLTNFGSIGSGKNSRTNVTVTDGGAIAAARDVGLASLDFAKRSQDSLQALTSAQAQASKDSVAAAYSLANQARQSETSGAINNVLKYGTWIALAALLAWAASKGKRGG